MKNSDAGHLVRMASLMLGVLAAFLLLRSALVPASFGKYGHYREAALADNRAHPIAFAGQQTCVACHDEVAAQRGQGKHRGVACEACHGPLHQHAQDPTGVKPKLPEVATLCVRCHEADAAKPATFPQVVSKDHSQGVICNTCHQPHRPKV